MMNPQMQVLQNLLDQSQWRSLEENKAKQWVHFQRLLNHAYETVPFYKQYYADDMPRNIVSDDDIRQLPVLYRKRIKAAGKSFTTQNLPVSHGRCYRMETSGSTGEAIEILGTDFTRLFYDALMLREHTWHKRDFSHTLMAIRWAKRGFADSPLGHSQSSWGPPIDHYYATGPSVFVNVVSKTIDQIEAVLFYKPHYLLTYPSQLKVLAEYCLENNLHFPFLVEIRTTGETLTAECISLAKEAWPQVKVSDIYSSVEIGNIAQQCLEYKNYHVNAENVYVEIVDDNDQPCPLGQSGRVLVTSLMNYATPLIRYDIGDYAEWGEPCFCRRGLPVLKKICGRQRNRLLLPTGESLFPYLGDREERKKITNAVLKFQFVQNTVNEVEYKIVVSEPITPQQEEQLKLLHQKNLGFPFNIIISYHDDIPKGPTGKYEEFVSRVAGNIGERSPPL